MTPDLMYQTVQVWGFLPGAYTQDQAPMLLDELLDILDFSKNESGQEKYPYEVFNDQIQENVTTSWEMLKKSFVESRAGKLGTSTVDGSVKYRNTPLSVWISGRDDRLESTPALWLEPAAQCFIEEGTISDVDVKTHTKQISQLVKQLHTRLNIPVFFGFGQAEPVGADVHPARSDALKGEIQSLYWLTLLPAKTVERIGKETVQSAPAVITDELVDGSVLVVTHENPRARDERYEATAEHLGLRNLGY